ncbi:MAG: S41 family peptidase [Bacillota bacterium]
MATTMENRAAVMEQLAVELERRYVFEEKGRALAAVLRNPPEELAGAAWGRELAEALTRVLREQTADKHLQVFYTADGGIPGSNLSEEEHRRLSAAQNGHIARVERKPGNVGYLDLLGFDRPQNSGEKAVAAMNLLADCSALIVDLTRCRGGSPEMVALFTSYLLDRPTHLNSLWWKEGDVTRPYWSLPYVPGRRFGGQRPLYVLTSSRTASAGEEFAYNLKNLKRAVLVGETTAGAANPGGIFPLPGGYEVFISLGRAVSPITGTNWEGVGVEPDLAVPKEEALSTAYRAALEQVTAGLEGAEGAADRALLAEARRAMADLQA